jgi:DNA-binding transcriptional LysR family regulator
MVFAPIVPVYLRRYPDMNVQIVTEGRIVDTVAEGFDAGIRLSNIVPQDMVRMPIDSDLQTTFVGSPEHISLFSITTSPADLAGYPCVRARFTCGAPSRWEFSRHGEPMNIEVSGPLTLNDPGLMCEAGLAGMYLAYVTDWYVRDDLAAGRLCACCRTGRSATEV